MPKKLTTKQRKVLAGLNATNPGLLSDISLWEISTAYSLGRIELDIPLKEYLTAASAPPLIQRASVSPAVAAEVAALPDSFHRDPGDRIIVATARVHKAILITADERIIASKLVKTL